MVTLRGNCLASSFIWGIAERITVVSVELPLRLRFVTTTVMIRKNVKRQWSPAVVRELPDGLTKEKGWWHRVGRCPYVIALRLGLWLVAWHVVARRFAFGLWYWLCAWLVRARLPSAARLLSLAAGGVWPFGKVAGGSRDTGGPSFFLSQPTKRLGHNLPNGKENTCLRVLTMYERKRIIRS